MVEISGEARDTVGYDAGKRVKGRKRHLVTDTLGLVLRIEVHSAGIQDRDGAAMSLSEPGPQVRRRDLANVGDTAIDLLAGYVGSSNAKLVRSTISRGGAFDRPNQAGADFVP